MNLKIIKNNVTRSLCLGISILMMGGCTSLGIDTADKMLARTPLGQYFGLEVNLRQNSYAAADYLVYQLQRQYVKREAGIEIVRLYNSDSPSLSSDFDHFVPEMIGVRLEELGYDVDFKAVNPALTNTANNVPQYRLSGHYRQEDDYYQMTLEVVDKAQQRQIAAFNYQIRRSWSLDKMATPKASIEIHHR